ncbi:MAG: beta-ketoacyl-ACP synthase III [Alteraurantiacibacter sp.]
MRRAVFLGSGSALPRRALTNAELALQVDTSDEWIRERTGITQRHVAGEGETTSTLAIEAARNALDNAGLTIAEIDLIVLATTTPDLTFPSTATIVQNALGGAGFAAFDVSAVCTGFIYALATAESMIRTGLATKALVIGAETLTRLIDWEDRTTCVLFGDGAGAFVIGAGPEDDATETGFLATQLHADGAHRDLLFTDGGVSTTGTSGHMRMKGREVFRHAVVNLAQVLQDVLAKSGYEAADIDWVVPHQANARILEATARKLNLPMSRMVVTVDRHANTSAASVPLAFDTAWRDGRIKRGQLVMLEAMGGGFTWGASLLRV